MHVPRSTGASRVDNPGLYDVLYLGDTAAGAIAEAFGWASVWDAGLFRGAPSLPGSVRALASYTLDDDHAVCDMDDTHRLVELELRPSQVVTRDRSVTQRWAAELFSQDRFVGVRWWSYYDARWGSLALWHADLLTVTDVEVLDDVAQPDFVEAAEVLARVRR